MGGMIACTLAAAAPRRVSSLTVIASTGGGSHVIPRSWTGLRNLARGMLAATPEDQASFCFQLLAMYFCGSVDWGSQHGRQAGFRFLARYLCAVILQQGATVPFSG